MSDEPKVDSTTGEQVSDSGAAKAPPPVQQTEQPTVQASSAPADAVQPAAAAATLAVAAPETPKPPEVAAPLPPEPQEPSVEASAPAAIQSDLQLALVIEDDFDASLIFSKALQAADLRVEIIRAGDAAVKRLSEIVPNLVILDLHLPEVDGTEILSRIRADWRLEKTRVIIVTADARMAEPVKDDADLVLLKPASYSQVRDFALRLSRRPQ